MAGSSYLSLMYGRGNIFSSSNNSSGNSYGNSNNNSYNNSYNSNSYSNSYNNSTRLGSNRLDYRYEEPPSYLCSMMHQWRQQPPSSIVTREETLHLTPTELRIEDYHCMRKQQIRSSLETRLKEAIHKEAFNPEILKFQFEHLPPVSSERPPDLDAIRSGRYGSGNSGGNGGNIFSGGSSNNGNGSSGNIFSRNSNGYSGNSGGYSGGNGGSSGGGNIFSGSSNNYNSYGYNNNSNNNIFSGGNNRSGYNSNSNNNISNNIFSGGSSSGGSSNNIFSRGSNNNTGNNIFSSGNQNNSSSNNIFSRGTNSSNNNIFSSNNNNNNGNIFSSNRGGGNNLFSNNSTSNNNNNSAINQELLLNLKMIMDSNQTFMRQMAQQLQLTPHQEEPPAPQSPFDQLLKHQPLKEIDRLFPEKPKQEEVVIIQPPWVDNYRQQLASSRITNNSRTIGQINSKTNLNEAEKGNRGFGGSRLYLNNQPGGSRLYLNNQPGGSQLINSQTVRCNNFPQQTVTNSISESHISRPINSKLSSRGPLHQNNQPFQPELPFSECGCQCLFTLAVEWKDDQYNELPHSTLTISLQLPNLEPNRPEWRQNVIALLKERKEVIRRDAQMTFTSGIQKQNHCYELVGILSQDIVNLGSDYRISYHQIRSFHLHNLTISNSYGSISWEKPIPLTNLDFTNTPEGPPFELADNTINCELLALNSPCRVTFFSLPPHITEIYRKDPEQARSAFSDFVSKSSEGAFKLEEIWEEGNDRGWSMFVIAFPQVPQQM